MRQLALDFDVPPAIRPIEPCDPRVPDAARPRLSRQCRAILDRLRAGPASNDELSRLARKYTGRISDIRKAGFVVECFDQDHASGRTWYRLTWDPEVNHAQDSDLIST
ncbi:MAG: hypothetical protein KGR26_09605 [Cyanobacteria bacterium REEB65]|nr:hypothetical protein [Cyanobacteria bacterium REEB65]